jgi:hypothetical protein
VTLKSNGEQVAEVRPREGGTYSLAASGGEAWTLSSRVEGEVRPFSMAVTRKEGSGAGEAVLTIRDHLFIHGSRFYLVGGIPRERRAREFLRGARFICRLDNFPFPSLAEVDQETKSRLRRHRGEVVGEFGGLGRDGHRVEIADELEEIGMPLAAACYLLYSSA